MKLIKISSMMVILSLMVTACAGESVKKEATEKATTAEVAVKPEASSSVVEVMLTAKLDEDRGYCLDIAGGRGTNAPVERGLQAHTCYNYNNSILEDQGFDPALVPGGQFKITYFDVCMSVASITAGASLDLSKCDGSDGQKFSLNSNGQIVSQVNPALCVTVNATEKKTGRGGTPPHVMRPVSLEACDAAKKDYQAWALNAL